ncbi:hypothetical protein I4U23_027240 [Adineta vaga]|nr:hypothetical protein I4U23_027240 [Adineta vaga]
MELFTRSLSVSNHSLNSSNNFSSWYSPVLIGGMSFSDYFLRPGTIAIVQVNSDMLSVAYNLLCSLRKAHADLLAKKLIFWAIDQSAVKDLESYRDKNNLSFGIYHFHSKFDQIKTIQVIGTNEYYELMRHRISVYLLFLEQFHLSFIFMDADIVFLNDPLNDLFFNEDRHEIEDLIYSTDARNFYNQLKDPFEGKPFVPPICGGFFLMRPTKPTIDLLKDLNKIMIIDSKANDQWTMDLLLNNRYDSLNNKFLYDSSRTWLVEPFPLGLKRKNTSIKTNNSIKLRLLDQRSYINGHIFGSLNNQYWNEIIQLQKINPFFRRFIIHFNSWVENKLELMKKNYLWLVGENKTCIL